MNRSERKAIVVTFLIMLIVLAVVVWICAQTAYARGYCTGKFGPETRVDWSTGMGITGECELAPAVPAHRVRVP